MEDPFHRVVFDTGESLSERIRRFEESRQDAWYERKRTGLTTTSAILVLSFLLLQLPKPFTDFWMLATAWGVLAASVAIHVAVSEIDYFVRRSAQKSHHEMGKLLMQFQQKRLAGTPPSVEEIKRESAKVQENDKPLQQRRARLNVIQAVLYYLSIILLITGLGLLMGFGVSNALN